MKMGKKGWIGLGVLAVVVVLIWTSATGRKVAVETASIAEESLQVFIQNEGYTRLQQSYRVSSPVAGKLQRVKKQVGDRVEQGETLFSVLPMELSGQHKVISEARITAVKARLSQAETALKGALESRTQVETYFNRQKALAADGIITTEQLEAAQLTLSDAVRLVQTSQETVEQVKAELKIEQTQLLETGVATSVSAHVSGVILTVFERNETSVAPGSPVLEIGDVRSLEVVVDVLSEDAVHIQANDRVTLSGWGGQDIQGTVLQVEPSAFTKISVLGVEEQRVNVIVGLGNVPEALGIGYRVEASILVEETERMPVAPMSAVFQEAGGWYVFAVVDGTIEKRNIEPGMQSADKMAIRSGLAAGDTVVLYSSPEIKEGVRVQQD